MTHNATRHPGPRSQPRTMGVEEELLLVDPTSGELVPVGPVVVARDVRTAGTPSDADGADAGTPGHDGADGADRPGTPLETELQQQQVETATPPRTLLTDLVDDLRGLRRRADAAAQEVGARVVALGTSPRPGVPVLTPVTRYRAMAQLMGVTADEQLTCGCHVHVGVESDEEGVAVLDRIRPWLAVLTALSTNSPYWNGADTGYAGYRTQVFQRFPTTGPTDRFGSPEGYHRLVADLLSTGALVDEGMMYFDARLSRSYPTVEVRVADVCLQPEDAVLVAALSRGLVETAAAQWRAGEPADDVPTPLLRMASWRASRSGLTTELVHPVHRRAAPAAEVVQDLVEHVRPALAASGDAPWVEQHVEEVLSRGTGADRQRRVAAATDDDLAAVVRDAVEVTVR
ncbi:glutamate--cysteine ligase [Actinotalea sp. Marseille-Q4924]|uniref:carboxylate-amine ligase n=1 Tax=Actinotalea sp. Marseille-Q4924 TaxID=2866571 RepID=UPI001CE44132|nr:glutamate--cysteine ligase [Actinotalea sp. Marseille-Q4924]